MAEATLRSGGQEKMDKSEAWAQVDSTETPHEWSE